MAIDTMQTLAVIEVMENFIARIRPPENIRSQVDISYRIEDQSIIIFEIRPEWTKPSALMEIDFAKTTFVKTNNNWRVFWKRSNGQWYPFTPEPTVKNLQEFTCLVEEDKYSCFRG